MSAADGTNNVGHGHVYPRPDGVLMRCGGPALCGECAIDAARKARIETTGTQVPLPVPTLSPKHLSEAEAIAMLWALWNDPKWSRFKADYLRGHLSYGNMLEERERPIREALGLE